MKENLKFFIAALLWFATILPLWFIEPTHRNNPLSLSWRTYIFILSILINIGILYLYYTLVSQLFDMVEAEEKLEENGK